MPEKRLALVIGNASYKAKPLATAVNDAALISQTLQSAEFDVIGTRDLDQGACFESFVTSQTKSQVREQVPSSSYTFPAMACNSPVRTT